MPKQNGEVIDYCLFDDLPSFIWAANMANLEVHTFRHRSQALHRPTALVFDLDPGPPADILTCCDVALHLKRIFDQLGLESFPKTSGSKGMQVFVPLNTPTSYEKTKAFARHLADTLSAQLPELVVADMKKKLRTGKVFIDWSQNDDKKTTATVYSLRARETPTVSTPLKWSEVKAALTGKRKPRGKVKRPLVFETKEVLARVKKWGDLFAPVLTLKQKLPPLAGIGEGG